MPTAQSAGKKVRKGTVFNAEADAKACLYTKPNSDVPYQPAEHLEGAMIKGACQIQWKGKKTFKDIVAQSIIISPREIPFKEPKDAKYEIDVTTCVIPATRGRVPVARPRWDDWAFAFTITNDNTDDLDGDTLKNILVEAGKVGIGTFRLKYGKFEVESFEKVA
jgi:hypothetical protein